MVKLKYQKLFFLIPLMFALFLRIPHIFQDSIWSDEGAYIWLSSRLSKDPSFLFNKALAGTSSTYVPIIISAILDIFTTSFIAFRVSILLTGLLGIYLVYLIGKKIMGPSEGFCAATLVASNGLHIFLSQRALTDISLTTFLTLMIYLILKIDGKTKKSGVNAALSVGVALFTKISGMLALPISLVSFALFKKKKIFEKGSVAFLIGVSVVSTLYIFMNFHFFGNFLPTTPGQYTSSHIFQGGPTYYIQSANHIFSWPIFLLMLLGSYFAFNEKKMYPVLIWFWFYFLFFSFLVGEKVPRYMTPAFPAAAILAVYGIYVIISKFSLPSYSIFLLLFVSIYTAQYGLSMTESKVHTYTGLRENGQTISELNAIYDFNKIYAQSARQMRAFSELSSSDSNKKVTSLPNNFESLLNQTNILVELDIWEYAAPDWAYPLTQEKVNKLLESNFSIVHISEREIPTQQGMQKTPVGLLLIK